MQYKYRHYIFDLDGTLADTSEGIYDAYRFTFEKMGMPLTDFDLLNGVIGAPLLDNFTERFGLPEEIAREAISIYRERYAQVGVKLVEVYPEIEELLCYLKKAGYRISVATMKRTDLARAILRRSGLLQYFHGVFGMDAQDSLTKADLIRLCMERSNCLPCQTILVGDSFSDFEGAEECGISFIGAGYGLGNINEYVPEVDKPGEGYWGIVKDSQDLMERLGEIVEADVTPPAAIKDGPIEVSVVVITYNHARFIRDCLDSILIQKTNFRFEILVGDDASPDDTQDILREYLDRYPTIFRMELRPTNLGATKNVYDMFLKAKGRYIAFAEGDDYWTDVKKLQIQYDFMEESPSYSFCSHRIISVNENRIPLSKQPDHVPKCETVITLKDLDGYHIPGYALSQFYRNFWPNQTHDWTIQYTAHPLIGDTTTWLLLLLQGDCY